MQPTENKQPAQDELIAHIRKNLKAHEEPYNLGAWENFSEKNENKKRPIFWIRTLSGVAAVIALCLSLFLWTNNSIEIKKNEVVKTSPFKVEQPIEANGIEDNPTPANETTAANAINQQPKTNISTNANQNATSAVIEQLSNQTNSVAVINEAATGNNQIAINTAVANQIAQNIIVEKPADQKTAIVAETKAKTTTEEFLASETKKNESSKEKFAKNITKSKWDLGLMVAPSFGNSKELNMGYGVSMGYNFSNKFSLITGVSYNEMTASKDFPTTMSSILLGNNRSLAAISQKVSGLDIPLELKYSFSKSVYANLGVSAFAVLGQSRNNTFIQEVVVKGTANNTTSSSGDPSGAVSDPTAAKGQFANSYIVNQKTVERAALEEQNDVNYLGFYNFSIGYKRRILKNHSVAIEPFVKLPIKQVTQDNLKLVGTGLRLKVDF